MKGILLVFLGGGLGSALRYALGTLMNVGSSGFPFGTLMVNLIGSLLIGLLFGLGERSLTKEIFLLFAAGFCGGFTTFSAFAYENFTFLRNGNYVALLIYSISTLIGGIILVYLGYRLSR